MYTLTYCAQPVQLTSHTFHQMGGSFLSSLASSPHSYPPYSTNPRSSSVLIRVPFLPFPSQKFHPSLKVPYHPFPSHKFHPSAPFPSQYFHPLSRTFVPIHPMIVPSRLYAVPAHTKYILQVQVHIYSLLCTLASPFERQAPSTRLMQKMLCQL